MNIEDYLSGRINYETPLVLATVIQAISPTSGKPGDKALVSAEKIVGGWIGGGCSQPAVIKAASKVLTDGKPIIIRIGPKGDSQSLNSVVDFTSSCLSGGTLVIFIEPLSLQTSLCVFGHSPVAVSLCEQAKKMDFSVSIASPEIDLINLSEGITHLIDFSDIQSEFIVIAKQGKRDKKAIAAALDSNARYIGMVASEKKITALKSQLLKENVTQSSLDRIHGPAGMDIGAETPAEIALSVLAELVRIRRSNQVVHEENNSKQKQSNHQQDDAEIKLEKGGCCAG